MFITMSTSTAPFLMASIVSSTLDSVVATPCGKAATVVTSTSVPSSSRQTMGRSDGRTQTDTQSYLLAMSHPSISSLTVMSGRSSEWSMVLATSWAVMCSPV